MARRALVVSHSADACVCAGCIGHLVCAQYTAIAWDAILLQCQLTSYWPGVYEHPADRLDTVIQCTLIGSRAPAFCLEHLSGIDTS